MFELTQDAETIIIWRQHNLIFYYRYEKMINWLIAGKCKETGHCQSVRMELDCPVTPDSKCLPSCGLIGVYY